MTNDKMTNEQKAKDITKCIWFPQKCTEGDIQNMLMQMAEWKDEQHKQEKQQLIDEACEWLNKTINSDIDGYAPNYPFDKMINDFKKAMKGE